MQNVLYAFISAPIVGFGHIIPSLQRANELRNDRRGVYKSSYLLVDDRIWGKYTVQNGALIPLSSIEQESLNITEVFNIQSFIAHLQQLIGRQDVNLSAYGDGNFEKALRLISNVEMNEFQIFDIIKDYVRFTDDQYGHRNGENGNTECATIVAGYFGFFYFYHFRLSIDENFLCNMILCDFKLVVIILASSSFGRAPFFTIINRYLRPPTVTVENLPTIASKYGNPIFLNECDAVFFSNPKMFKAQFLSLLIIAAHYLKENAYIYLYDIRECDAELKRYLENLCKIDQKLEKVLQYIDSDHGHQKPNMTEHMKQFQSVAVIAEGVGAMQTASAMRNFFIFQATKNTFDDIFYDNGTLKNSNIFAGYRAEGLVEGFSDSLYTRGMRHFLHCIVEFRRHLLQFQHNSFEPILKHDSLLDKYIYENQKQALCDIFYFYQSDFKSMMMEYGKTLTIMPHRPLACAYYDMVETKLFPAHSGGRCRFPIP